MIALREFLVRNRSRLALVAVLGALAFLVAIEHSGLGHDEPHGDGMSGVAAMCLAIADASAVGLLGGLAAVGMTRRRRARALPSVPDSPGLLRGPEPFAPRSRAGPTQLCVVRR